MHKPSYYMVNGITLYRLLAAPFLVLLVINPQPGLFKWLLAASFFTDAIDGYLARRYKVTSALGSRIDSIADDLTVAVAAVGIIAFKPEFIKQEMALLVLLLALFLLQVVLAFIRYGKMSSFHTYIAKVAAILQGIFLILFFFLPRPFEPLFYATVIVTGIDLLEEITLVLILPQWRTNVKGLYWIMRAKHAGKTS